MSLGGPSFWIETTPETNYPALTDGTTVEVAVVGAGITGITAAMVLKRAGKTVDLIDSKRIVRGAPGTPSHPSAGTSTVFVDWNPAERTCDCPCHGSRYDGEGRVIQGPTTRDLTRRELPDNLR